VRHLKHIGTATVTIIPKIPAAASGGIIKTDGRTKTYFGRRGLEIGNRALQNIDTNLNDGLLIVRVQDRQRYRSTPRGTPAY